MHTKFATAIMAAGKGTRMKDASKAKVMFAVKGKPMLQHVVDLAESLGSDKIISIVGFHRESVIEFLNKLASDVGTVVQEPQLGTGHAIMQTEPMLRNYDGDVLVLSGDVPMLRKETIAKLIEHHRESNAVGTILTAVLDDPTGYGRVLRNKNGNVTGIMEQKDASETQRVVKEINSGIYIFDAKYLFDALQHINPHNAQNEYYLTDVFGYFWNHHFIISAVSADDFNEIRGVNTLEQLKEAEDVLNARNK
jgi:UDP-N-acetylglucosamine pyrophosphorylase